MDAAGGGGHCRFMGCVCLAVVSLAPGGNGPVRMQRQGVRITGCERNYIASSARCICLSEGVVAPSEDLVHPYRDRFRYRGPGPVAHGEGVNAFVRVATCGMSSIDGRAPVIPEPSESRRPSFSQA